MSCRNELQQMMVVGFAAAVLIACGGTPASTPAAEIPISNKDLIWIEPLDLTEKAYGTRFGRLVWQHQASR